MRFRVWAAGLALLALAGCGSTDPRETGLYDSDSTMAKADPAFAAHFTDVVYKDVSDERTPFGSDFGADLLEEWDGRRDELGPTSTVADLLGADPDEMLSSHSFDEAQAVQAAGFTLLRLTGHIDPEGKRATLAALDQLLSPELAGEHDPVYNRQRQDLLAWAE